MSPEKSPRTDQQRNVNLVPIWETIKHVLPEINGENIERRLLRLAQIGGTPITSTPELPQRYAVNRLALMPNDLAARSMLAAEMQDAGMTFTEHPLGLIGIYPGTNPNLPAVAMLSHTDSVPNAGMYDGTVGVTSAIEIVKALYKHNVQFPRPIMVLSLTGEESARFNMALFGSRGIFQGFTDDELAAQKPGDVTVARAIQDAGFDPEMLRQPTLSPQQIAAAIELHVAQDDRLEAGIGIVEAIAAPVRYQVTIGETSLEPDTNYYPNASYLKLLVQGKAGHSGATPMGNDFRADGLVALVDVLSELPMQDGNVSIGEIVIEEEALNKIPGKTEVILRIIDDNNTTYLQRLKKYIIDKNNALNEHSPKFSVNAITLDKVAKADVLTDFYDAPEMLRRQRVACDVIKTVNKVSIEHTESKIVGTVGTYRVEHGQILLGVDIRGINLETRNVAVAEIQNEINQAASKKQLPLPIFGPPLPGSGEPVEMDGQLVYLADQLAEQLQILPHPIIFSPAGHDTQNVARAEIPSVMIFCPSRKDGIAHTPEEYSTPEDLQNGAKAMAALVMYLAADET